MLVHCLCVYVSVTEIFYSVICYFISYCVRIMHEFSLSVIQVYFKGKSEFDIKALVVPIDVVFCFFFTLKQYTIEILYTCIGILK